PSTPTARPGRTRGTSARCGRMHTYMEVTVVPPYGTRHQVVSTSFWESFGRKQLTRRDCIWSSVQSMEYTSTWAHSLLFRVVRFTNPAAGLVYAPYRCASYFWSRYVEGKCDRGHDFERRRNVDRPWLRVIVPALAAGLGCSFGGTSPRPVAARIQIRETSPFLMDVAGGPELLSADVLDSTGALITTRVRIAWSSTDTSVVRVDETGTLQPRNVGFSTIHAVVDANGAQVQDSI